MKSFSKPDNCLSSSKNIVSVITRDRISMFLDNFTESVQLQLGEHYRRLVCL